MRHGGHFPLLVFRGAAGGHGGGGTDANHILTAEVEAAPANEEGHIGALASAIGVQFVKHQEPQAPGRPDQGTVFIAGEQQFQHHVVCEQDIRRVGADRLALVLFLLAGITGETDGLLPFLITPPDEFLQFFVLTVRQGVHGIHHNGLNPPAGTMAQDMVHNGDNIGQAFSRAGAAGKHIGL
ncbi:MAG: hypothetical protein BWX80_02763 [Candidatus Hydrogenedentes bacterium ADurb.Bin101]|nr:MAG: hypothetical protein BWX80_02763 [Candidatus Hydrogenedentes bacterium ADurb.Bin101]